MRGGAHQDRHIIEAMALVLKRLDFIGDLSRFLLGIPGTCHRNLLTFLTLGEEGFAQTPFIFSDQEPCCAQNMPGGAIIALKTDHGCAGKILLEAQNIIHLGTAPAIDGLIIIAHAANVALARRQQTQPEILRNIGILILIHEDILEAPLILRNNFRIFLKQADRLKQQITEISSIKNFQALLIECIKRFALAFREGECLPLRDAIRRQGTVFPPVNLHGQHARWPALLIHIFGLKHLFQKADLIIGIQNGEI